MRLDCVENDIKDVMPKRKIGYLMWKEVCSNY